MDGFLKQAASAATKLAEQQAAPAAEAPAKPAAAAPEKPDTAAAPDAAAPAAAAPAADAPVDIKSTLLHAVDEFKTGDYMGAAQDVMKTGLVQKLAASQGKPAEGGAEGGSSDVMGMLGQAASALGGLSKK